MEDSFDIKYEGKQKNKYDMRAAPRRRMKGDDTEDQPVFLRKAFAMISSCPSDIGGWSESGDTVVIKDIKQFAEKIIPTAYKHNNFSSFVRQLNFYGFRKIKADSLDRSTWWEFRHPQFLRDQPHLLSEIKRSVHYVPESPTVHEVSDLKNQVSSLNDRISSLTDQIAGLTDMVNDMKISKPVVIKTEKESNKKRKTSEMDGGKPECLLDPPHQSVEFVIEGPELMRMSSFDSQIYVNELSEQETTHRPPTGPELQALAGSNNDDSLNFDSFWDMEDDLAVTPLPTATEIPSNIAINEFMSSGTNFSQMINGLSPELKNRFVDKLAEEMGKQLSGIFSSNAVAAEASASAAVMAKTDLPDVIKEKVISNTKLESSAPQFNLPSGSRAPEIALPLASAAIGAFGAYISAAVRSQVASVVDPNSSMKAELV